MEKRTSPFEQSRTRKNCDKARNEQQKAVLLDYRAASLCAANRSLAQTTNHTMSRSRELTKSSRLLRNCQQNTTGSKS